MPRPVCVRCQCEFRCEKNDTLIVEMIADGPYKLWSADAWKCPGCSVEIIADFGFIPLSVRHESSFAHILKTYQGPGRRIEYVYEQPHRR